MADTFGNLGREARNSPISKTSEIGFLSNNQVEERGPANCHAFTKAYGSDYRHQHNLDTHCVPATINIDGKLLENADHFNYFRSYLARKANFIKRCSTD